MSSISKILYFSVFACLSSGCSNIGMDSIAIIELQNEITKKFGLAQEDLNIYPDDSVGSLQNKIYPFIEEKKSD